MRGVLKLLDMDKERKAPFYWSAPQSLGRRRGRSRVNTPRHRPKKPRKKIKI